MKINIALLAGGESSEREISLQSATQIENALDCSKYNTYRIDLNGRSWQYTNADGEIYNVNKNDFSLTIGNTYIALDYALIIIHGTPGEDGKLQGYLEMMRIPYSSCDMVSSVITFDKATCKKSVAGFGINLAKDIFLRRDDKVDPEAIVGQLGLPLFVKPNSSGSSFGVTKVKSVDHILAAINEAFKESDAVLIEEYIDGREFGCGVLITKDKEYMLPITEIISKKEFFDYQAKYTTGFSNEITPADIPSELVKQMNEITRNAYKACRCRGVVRIDFIVTNAGVPYMIEINSIPGMSGGSIVPKQAACMGMSLGELYDIIIEDTYTK